MFCKFCGLKLPADALFCVGCGAPAEPAAADKNVAAKTRPGGNVPQRGLVGWSDKCNHPEIIAAAQKNKKSAIGCAYVLTLLFPIGFFIAGLLVDELPLGEAVIIGAGLGLFMLLINLMRVRGMKKQIWAGLSRTRRILTERTSNAPWAEFLPEIENIVVGDGVTIIGDYALAFCTNLKSVEVDKYVKRPSDYGTHAHPFAGWRTTGSDDCGKDRG